MSSEVDWVLDQLASVVTSVGNDYTITNQDGTTDPVEIKRVDRTDARIYDGDQPVDMTTPIRSRTGELRTGIFIGAQAAGVDQSPIGTEFDLDVERVVGLRVEGLIADEWGHVDPDGADGVPWEELKSRIRSALYDARTYPDAGATGTSYTHLLLTNEANQSDTYADYYRWDVDVAFDGFEDL